MSLLVSLDPGLRACGLALFQDRELIGAFLPRNTEQKTRGALAWRAMADSVFLDLLNFGFHPIEEHDLVIEYPQVYGGPREEDPNDLIEITGVDGAVVGRLLPRRVISYKPREWKGQVPKEIHNKRVLSRLTLDEKAVLKRADVPASLLHNVIDAIGIGLFYLGRAGV